MEKALAFYGVRNAKYAQKDADGKLGTKSVALPKAKSLQLNASVNMSEVFANDEKILSIPSDQGYTGTYGCTGQDIDFEEAIGQLIKLEDGTVATVKINDMERFELYYEYTVKPETGKAFILKSWIYGVELGKPSKNHQTNTQNLTIGEYQYPLTVYGEKIVDAQDKPYCDEEGNELVALIVMSVPGDADYKTFGEKPPKPVKSNITTP